MNAFIYIILCLLCLIGLTSLIRGIVYFFLKYDLSKRAVTVVFLDDESFDISILSAVEICKFKRGLPNFIVAVDDGLSRANKQKAELLLRDYNIEIYKNNDTFSNMRNLLKDERKL